MINKYAPLKKLYIAALSALCMITSVSSKAQLTITPSQTAAVLAQKLVGSGVAMMNPVLTCQGSAEGTFVAVASNLGIDSGIILTSGDAAGAGNPASYFVSACNGTPGDAQLTALSNQTTHDACILEFDFRPQGDTVKFKYVFGSEEYASYTCSSFNDVFGFLISGPGIPTPTNIALVPGTNIPVSVNSVNAGATGGWPISTCNAIGPGSPFGAYYVNNSTGTTVAYNGFTTVLEAIATVVPCDTYHLKLGVADASDCVFDSGVFIEAGSLSSTGITITPLGIGGQAASVPYCVRGCQPGQFVFSINVPHTDTFTIHYAVTGSAINGYDYSTIPDSVNIAPGDTTTTLYVFPLSVPPIGATTVTLLIYSPYICNGVPVVADSAVLTIYDSFNVHILTPDTGICLGQSVNIAATGDTFLSYQWSPGIGVSNPNILHPAITPMVTTTYTITANFPGAGCVPVSDQITISVYQPPVITANVFPTITCLGVPVQLNASAGPPGQTYVYNWAGPSVANPASPNTTAIPTAPGNYTYTINVDNVIPACGATQTFNVEILPNDFTMVDPFDTICLGDAVTVAAAGPTEFTYLWTPPYGVSDVNSIAPVLSPATPGAYTYSLTATYPTCPDMTHTFHLDVLAPAPTVPMFLNTCIGTPLTIDVTVPGAIPFVYAWSPGTYLNTVAGPVVVNSPTDSGDVTYIVTLHPQGATCVSFDTIHVHTVPNYFTILNPDSLICKGAMVQMNVLGDTELTYTWTPSMYVSDPNIMEPTVSPQTSITYTLTATYPQASAPGGCPPVTHSVFYNVEDPHVHIYPRDTAFCIFNPVQITSIATPLDSTFTYTWTQNDGNLSDLTVADPYFFTNTPGSYQYVLTVHTIAGCPAWDTLNVTTYQRVHVVASPADTIINYGDAVQLNAFDTYYNNCTFFWSPDNGTLDNPNIYNPIASPLDSIMYTVFCMSQWGCIDSATVNIGVDNSSSVTTINAFTPNGDGMNDYFRPANMRYQKILDFRVFNRWGNLVYHSSGSDKQIGWDGKFNGIPQELGVYNYVLIVSRPDGTEKEYKGDVTLIR